MSYSIQEFEKKHLHQFQQLRAIEEEKKRLDGISKQVKEKILQAMLENDVKGLENDIVKITVTKASESTSVDLKELQKQEPRLYGELLEDYPKVTRRSESLRVTFK